MGGLPDPNCSHLKYATREQSILTSAISAHSAQVILITDENCRVSARIEGSREQGIVQGDRVVKGGTPGIGLGFLSKQASLEKGRNVYTSGIGKVYPAGILIGSIEDSMRPRV